MAGKAEEKLLDPSSTLLPLSCGPPSSQWVGLKRHHAIKTRKGQPGSRLRVALSSCRTPGVANDPGASVFTLENEVHAERTKCGHSYEAPS